MLALMGTVLTIGPTGNGRLPGILLPLAAAVIYSGYILVGSRLMPHASAIGASTIVISAAAAVYIGIVAVRGPVFPSTLSGWGAVVAIALISTVCPSSRSSQVWSGSDQAKPLLSPHWSLS